jgi:hypothetical protein
MTQNRLLAQGSVVKIFDPYSDWLARNIHNSLSSALVKDLTGEATDALSVAADVWLAKSLARIYQTYIESRSALYRSVIDEMKACQVTDIRYQAIYLWNRDLFFEMHELLETIWHQSRDPERSALKGWIQAAGVYVLFQRGKVNAARGLAKRAANHLQNGRSCLGFIANLDELMAAVADPADGAPKLVIDRT